MLADTGQFMARLDAEGFDEPGWPIPDSPKLRVTPPNRRSPLGRRSLDHAAALFVDHAGAAAAFQGHAMGVGPRFDAQVRPV